MPDIYLLIDLIVVVALFGLAFIVLIRDSATLLNRVFAIFAVCIAIWIVANYISNDVNLSTHVATTANHFVFGFSFGAAVYLLRFGIALAEDAKAQRLFRRIKLFLLLVAIVAFTPLVVAGVVRQGDVYAVIFGPLSWVYFVALIVITAWVPYLLFRNIKRSHGDQKKRLEVIFISLCLALPFLILTEAILPAVTGWFGLTNIGVLPMLILVAGLYYSAAKHRLFSLRLVVVRALAYVATLGVILTIYGLVSYYGTNAVAVVRGKFLATVLQALLVVVAVVTYRPLKKYFDKITNGLFYRDAYEPQILMDNLNQALVNNIELHSLLESASRVIVDNLKAQHCRFVIRTNDNENMRNVGTVKLDITKDDAESLSELIRSLGHNVVVAESLTQHESKLRRLMGKLDAAVVARIIPEASNGRGGLREAYILLGQKQSGNIYTSQDGQILGIIANELLIAIQNALHFEEIQRFNVTLQEEIDNKTRELRRKNKRLEELDDIKDDFISMASHQLRTPLTSVKGYLSMVLEGDAGTINAQQAKMLGQAFTSAQRMVFLITDLLNVSRLKTGKFVIDAAPINLSETIQEEIQQLKEAAAGKSIQLIYKKPANFPRLMLDEVKIRQVLMNFIDNAIYYTPVGGHIRVELVEKTSTVELRVVDDGIGVPRSEQHHLFTKFYRATNARRARPDGTGLGLFMAAKVISAQGGSIIFSSREGKGSTFGFAFSKSRLRVPASKPLDAALSDKPVAKQAAERA